jgi:hypothetical protein
MSDPNSFDPDFQCVEVHDEVIGFETVDGELRAYLADGSYYVVGISDKRKLVVHLGRDLLSS